MTGTAACRAACISRSRFPVRISTSAGSSGCPGRVEAGWRFCRSSPRGNWGRSFRRSLWRIGLWLVLLRVNRGNNQEKRSCEHQFIHGVLRQPATEYAAILSLFRLPGVERCEDGVGLSSLRIQLTLVIPRCGARRGICFFAHLNPREILHFVQNDKKLAWATVVGLLRWGYKGILPCFFLGLVSRLVSSERRAVISFARVCDGSITASTYPRSAATYGLAKRSRNSATFSRRRRSRSASGARSISRL